MTTTEGMTRSRKLRGILWPGLVVAAIVVLALTVGLADPAGAVTITEFPATGGGITAGPDGALWFTENTNKIGRITTAGTLTEFPVSNWPRAITGGPDGALWFTEWGDLCCPHQLISKIGRITTAGVLTEFPLPLAAESEYGPTAITAGSDGALWFIWKGSSQDRLERITTVGVVTEFPLPTGNEGIVAMSITAGPDGALWFTDEGSRIGRMTTAGTLTEFLLPLNSAPEGITTGPDGALWFTDPGTNKIGRITTAGVVTEFAVPSTAGIRLGGITTGPDGALWFTETGCATCTSITGKIGRITTAGVVTEFPLPRAGNVPVSITAGPDGALWFTETGCTGCVNKIGRITTDTGPATAVSPGQAGDALIFPLFDVNNLNTLIAIESFTDRTTLARVRFREEVSGSSVLAFDLCLTPFSTWTAAIFRDGTVTRLVSSSTLLVNGSATPLNTVVSPDATRGFIEVVGLRGTTTASSDTAICTDASSGGDAFNGFMGKAYYVNPAQSPILAYGANALALKDFAAGKISDGTVLGNNAVANALVLQGTQPGSESGDFGSRYFVDPAFGAETQVVVAFATGPVSGGCPSCKVPSSLTFAPVTESGTALASFARSTSSHLVNVFTLTSSDIASPSGVFDAFDTSLAVKSPVAGFVVQTTSAPPPGSPFFNVLFPLAIK